jgi:hypothetical protein
MHNSPGQSARYHSFGLCVWGCISVPSLDRSHLAIEQCACMFPYTRPLHAAITLDITRKTRHYNSLLCHNYSKNLQCRVTYRPKVNLMEQGGPSSVVYNNIVDVRGLYLSCDTGHSDRYFQQPSVCPGRSRHSAVN